MSASKTKKYGKCLHQNEVWCVQKISSCKRILEAEVGKSAVTSERLALIAVAQIALVCFHQQTVHQDGLAVSTASTARYPTYTPPRKLNQ